jgi:hypothetical protein
MEEVEQALEGVLQDNLFLSAAQKEGIHARKR